MLALWQVGNLESHPNNLGALAWDEETDFKLNPWYFSDLIGNTDII
jgi:hypothetical protein